MKKQHVGEPTRSPTISIHSTEYFDNENIPCHYVGEYGFDYSIKQKISH